MTGDRESHHVGWRMLFALAGAYNIAFGAWAIAFPTMSFDWFELGQPSHVWAWSCLGMVIGVYGLGYAYVAWKPARGDVIVALGLLGKLLGPIGWLIALNREEIPPRTFPMILFNDVVWWFPFAAYLMRRTSYRYAALAWIMIAFHLGASVMLLVVSGGTELQSEIGQRMQFIQRHVPLWTTCWLLWAGASAGLLAFFVVWALSLQRIGAPRLVPAIACGIAAIGLGCDLASESISIVCLTQAIAKLQFQQCADWATWLGAGLANGLYCVAGCALWWVSWQSDFQRGLKAVIGMSVWAVGIGLSLAAFMHRADLMVAFGAGLMLLFIPWATATSLQFRIYPAAMRNS